jgi:hypothetical protein
MVEVNASRCRCATEAAPSRLPFPVPKLWNFVRNAVRVRRLSHHQFDLAAFKGSHRKSIASHLFDDRPICEKVLLRL